MENKYNSNIRLTQEDINNMQDEGKLRAIVTITRILFERDNFQIISAAVVNVKQGTPFFSSNYRGKKTITIKGHFDVLKNAGETCVLVGQLKPAQSNYPPFYHSYYLGEAFEIDTPEEQHAFLSGILTETQVDNLYKVFPNPFEIIRQKDIKALQKVHGIGEYKAQKIVEKYEQNIHKGVLIAHFQKYDIPQGTIDSIINYYGTAEKALEEIKINPYVLTKVRGIGFAKADKIALRMGIDPNSIYRYKAYIVYALKKLAEQGHTYESGSIFMNDTRNFFGFVEFSADTFKQAMKELKQEKIIYYPDIPKPTFFALRYYFLLESRIYKELWRIQNAPNQTANMQDLDERIADIEQQQGIVFTDEQREAIKTVMNNNLAIITGKAGCVDCDTEYFNGKQWKKISEYTEGEQVLQYNPETGEASLTLPEAYIKEPCDTMWHFETKYGLDQTLSEEHRNLVISPKGVQKVINTVDLVEKMNNNQFYDRFITTFSYSGMGLDLTDEQIRVMCAIICDGSFSADRPNNLFCRFHLKKDRKKNRLRQLLKQANIGWKEHNSAAQGYTDFYFTAPRREKSFTEQWYKCTSEQLSIVCDEVLHWDGAINGNRKTFSTTIKQTADFIQFAFTSIGKRATIFIQDRRNKERKNSKYQYKTVEYTVSITDRILCGVTTDKRQTHTPTKAVKVTPTDLTKYCFTVPNDTLVLRRNNKIFITKNSGKSTVSNGFLKLMPEGSNPILCALSGRAACRIGEISNIEASTIHRLLPQGSLKDEEEAVNDSNYTDKYTGQFLSTKIVVLDEATMVDINIFYSLIRMIPDGAKLVLMGDIAQLETVGTGNIFGDLLGDEKEPMDVFPTARLTKIHRQSAKSAIKTESLKVSNSIPLFHNDYVGVEVRGEQQDLILDIFNYNKQDKEITIKKTLHYWKEAFSKLNDIRKIIVLTGRRNNGTLNTRALNEEIQNIYNPHNPSKAEVILKRRKEEEKTKQSSNGATDEIADSLTYITIFREGDRIMNLKNNYRMFTVMPDYDISLLLSSESREYLKNLPLIRGGALPITPIFNGYVGTIEQLSNFGMIINFDTVGRVFVPCDLYNNFDLGYASTVHKYQGCECDTVIFTIDESTGILLNTRQMVYTGITRAKNKCYLIGDNSSINYAIFNNKVIKKKTFLKDLLKERIVPISNVEDEEYYNLLQLREKIKTEQCLTIPENTIEENDMLW